MTLKEYAEKIAALAEKHPDALAVFSSDEEGNSYSEVYFEPIAGIYDGEENEFRNFCNDGEEPNAVCVN